MARQAREQFVTCAQEVLAPLAEALRARLAELADSGGTTRDMHERRDALMAFQRHRTGWTAAVQKGWQAALEPAPTTARSALDAGSFELIGDDVVEQKIISSRLSLAILEKATWQINDLRLRMQHLEGGQELQPGDLLRPEVLSQVMVEQWIAVGLTRQSWLLLQELIHRLMVERMLLAYEQTNAFLIKKGVMPDIDLSARVKRNADTTRSPLTAPGAISSAQAGVPSRPQALGPAGGPGYSAGGGGAGAGGFGGGSGGPGSSGSTGYGNAASGSNAGGGWGGSAGAGGPAGQSRPAGAGGTGFGSAGVPGRAAGGGNTVQGSAGAGAGGFGAGGGGRSGNGQVGGGSRGAGSSGAGTGSGSPRRNDSPGFGASSPMSGGDGLRAQGSRQGGVGDETRMMTATTPLARARARASGVIGQLKRLLTEKVAGFDPEHVTRPSPALAEAMAHHGSYAKTQLYEGAPTVSEVIVYDDAAVERVAGELRQRSGELKKKAATSTEKATIEVVALMFQAILAEERIPPGVRVWFSRLQMPVLRVALAEPEFFGTLQHPARQLIDRMGSCVMGFDAAAIGGSALEIEIKRVVQVIEQYPETGRRVFQLVYDEFLKFLSRFLTEKGPAQRIATVAQQVEQKETMAIQYTIEMRKMLNDMPVRDEIREFLFKVWAEVLAVAAVKNGPQHEETITLKKSAADLVWAASAKPNRNDRAQVIEDLPKLLLRLRHGMSLMGIQGGAQEAHIKIIGDTLADAFLSKTEAIPQAQIEAMAKRLANLEDYVADDPETDLPLDADSIELMLGIDASMMEVVADGGSRPNDAMLAWALELELGNWFTLDHNGKMNHLQYAWRSERRQLHLFASAEGRSFLIQARRLAAYLQAGLLLPDEEETLTVRATRDALAKLDANPERLLT